MRLLDSNIIIYAANPRHAFLRDIISKQKHYVSVISKLEVLGYHNLNAEERRLLVVFFNSARVISISDELIEIAIALRQKQKLSVADSIIAATALQNKLELVTRNVDDFKIIRELRIYNPFEH